MWPSHPAHQVHSWRSYLPLEELLRAQELMGEDPVPRGAAAWGLVALWPWQKGERTVMGALKQRAAPSAWGDSCPQGPMEWGHPSPAGEVNCPLRGSDPKRCCWRSSPAEGSGWGRGGVSGGGTSRDKPCCTPRSRGGPHAGLLGTASPGEGLTPSKRSGQDLAQGPFFPLR